jgi:hypothetical protein
MTLDEIIIAIVVSYFLKEWVLMFWVNKRGKNEED